MKMPKLEQILELTQVVDLRIESLGYVESQRRLGRPIDQDLLQALYSVDGDGNITPTDYYNEVLDKLA